MFRFESRNTLEVCDRPSDFQNAIVGTGAEALLCHGAFQQAFAFRGQFAVRADLASTHRGVAVSLLAAADKAL